jgi:hypothetical protein
MPSYLVHFNRLHDKNGRFTYGDGDGDGARNDKSSDKYNKNVGLHKVTYNVNGTNRFSGSERIANAKFTAGKVNREGFGNSLAGNHSRSERSFTNQHTGTIKSVPKNITSKFGPVTPKTPGLGDGSGRSKGDWSGNSSGKGSNQQSGKSINFVGYPKSEGSNITVVGGSSKGAGVSLSSEQIENYKVSGENWVTDTIDKITDPEWWKEKEKKARVQLGVYVKADKTAPKKQVKKKTR